MYLAAVETAARTWPDVILTLGLLAAAFFFIVLVVVTFSEFRKDKGAASQAEDLRQLVDRYEQLAEKTLDAHQRTAADVSELRSRTASIEQILRSVE